MRFFAAASVALSAATVSLAVPLVERAVNAVSIEQLSSFAPFTQFARAAYCESSKIENWGCGEACDALPGFEPTLTGGDGASVQLFFVGYWPSQNAVVVAHQGTDPLELESVLTDTDFFLDNLDEKLFPGVSSDVQVHNGFGEAHAETAQAILAETNNLISSKGANQVLVIGHSLGGALAELDSVFLSLNLPAEINIKAVTYGKPRVGNAEWAALVDSKISDFTRINNDHDLVPIIPGRGLGFAHPHGEVHITSPGEAVACVDNDDANDSKCTIKTVPNIFFGNVLDHLGPYEGIFLGTLFCN